MPAISLAPTLVCAGSPARMLVRGEPNLISAEAL